jgi:hypothetical protein
MAGSLDARDTLVTGGWGDRTGLTISAEGLQYRNSDPRPPDL